MSNHLININQNGTTTLATAGKYCDRDVDIVVNIASSGGELPEEALNITGSCTYKFSYNNWNWFLKEYSNRITTADLIDTNLMFMNSSNQETIPFDFNYSGVYYADVSRMFDGCFNLKEIGAINNLIPRDMNQMFKNCHNLRYLPEFNNLDMSHLGSQGGFLMFEGCSSLREIKPSFLKQLKNNRTANSYCAPYGSLKSMFALDKLIEVPVVLSKLTTNRFSCQQNYRLKELIFEVNDDNSPISASWKSQVIDLTFSIGYGTNIDDITTYYNSGITKDKEVYDDATYQLLKNDPDWFSLNVAYSRYNHTSAVNTINSLPDTTSGGGVNTIKFLGESGSATDGGAINTLTEEEIAVATAKGWTVSLV